MSASLNAPVPWLFRAAETVSPVGRALLPVFPLVMGKSDPATGTACPYYGTTDSSRICRRRVSVTALGNKGEAIYRDDAHKCQHPPGNFRTMNAVFPGSRTTRVDRDPRHREVGSVPASDRASPPEVPLQNCSLAIADTRLFDISSGSAIRQPVLAADFTPP